MAKVEYADAIKTVSGALTKINKKSPHAADQKMVLATHRVAATTNPACSRLYLRGLSSVTAISRAVNTRRKDLAHVAEDLAAFNAQKDTAGGYKTMRQYLWHVCAAEYNG